MSTKKVVGDEDTNLRLDDMIQKYANGSVTFDSDESDALFEAVAKKANKLRPLPETKEEIEEFLESIPLFASRMPEEGKESDAFKALKQVINKMPVDKRASNFRENGNKSFKLAVRLGEPRPNETAEDKARRLQARIEKYHDAINSYTAALNIDIESKDLLSTIYANRAQCQLALENYGKTVDDCKQAIAANPMNHKAYFRAATALFKLHKLEPAFGVCYRAITTIDVCKTKGTAERKAFIELMKKIVDVYKRTIAVEKQKYEERKAAEEKKAAEKAVLDAAIEKRGLKMGAEQFRDITVHYQGQPRVDEKGILHWPVVFLYPSKEQSDFVQDCSEQTKVSDILKLMFPPTAAPPPWDEDGEYVCGQLEVYVRVGQSDVYGEDAVRIDSQHGTKVVVNQSLTLGHALKALAKKGHVIPGYPIFCVEPLNPVSRSSSNAATTNGDASAS